MSPRNHKNERDDIGMAVDTDIMRIERMTLPARLR